MDTALILKIEHRKGLISDYESAKHFLEQSDLLRQLLAENFQFESYQLMNRLNEIAEIPFTQYIPKVQEWLAILNSLTACDEGFSLTKKKDYILSCYNGMLTSLFIRMEYSNHKEIHQGINWITKYQRFERNTPTEWNGSGILRYGGCLKAIPCYIGIVKSIIALSEYKKSIYYQSNQIVESKFNQGIDYILNQNVYLRKSTNEPITNYITSLSYPFTWKTNVIEILRMLKSNGFVNDSRCNFAMEYLKSKQKDNGIWYANAGYKPKGWILFDKPKESSLWISQEIQEILEISNNNCPLE